MEIVFLSASIFHLLVSTERSGSLPLYVRTNDFGHYIGNSNSRMDRPHARRNPAFLCFTPFGVKQRFLDENWGVA